MVGKIKNNPLILLAVLVFICGMAIVRISCAVSSEVKELSARISSLEAAKKREQTEQEEQEFLEITKPKIMSKEAHPTPPKEVVGWELDKCDTAIVTSDGTTSLRISCWYDEVTE